MAVFGDPDLFSEFDNSNRDSDKCMLEKLECENSYSPKDENGMTDSAGGIPANVQSESASVVDNPVSYKLELDQSSLPNNVHSPVCVDEVDDCVSQKRNIEMEKEIVQLKLENILFGHHTEYCTCLDARLLMFV